MFLRRLYGQAYTDLLCDQQGNSIQDKINKQSRKQTWDYVIHIFLAIINYTRIQKFRLQCSIPSKYQQRTSNPQLAFLSQNKYVNSKTSATIQQKDLKDNEKIIIVCAINDREDYVQYSYWRRMHRLWLVILHDNSCIHDNRILYFVLENTKIKG